MNFHGGEPHLGRGRLFTIVETAIIVTPDLQNRFWKGPDQALLKKAQACNWTPLPVRAPGGWIRTGIQQQLGVIMEKG